MAETPDFGAFAELSERLNAMAADLSDRIENAEFVRKLTESYDGPAITTFTYSVDFAGDVVQGLRESERHARLLQAVWEWAQQPALQSAHDDRWDAHFYRGIESSRAHVRALLAPREGK